MTSPFTNAVSVISMIATTPTYHTWFDLCTLVSLAIQAWFVYAILADCTILYCHIPTPECNCIPWFNFNSFIYLHGLFEYLYIYSIWFRKRYLNMKFLILGVVGLGYVHAQANCGEGKVTNSQNFCIQPDYIDGCLQYKTSRHCSRC